MPIKETVRPSTGLGALFKHRFSCDWLGQMTTFLQQGWRLVEIFLNLSNAPKDHSIAATINLFRFFEKETIRVNDPSPVYEGSGSQFFVK